MRERIINVDENIVETLRKLTDESIEKLNKGIGMWGNRALNYIFSDAASFPLQIELEERENGINEYGKLIDRKAAEMFEVMRPKLEKLPQFQKTGDFISDLQKNNEIKHIIEENIYAELIYVEELVRP